MVHFDFESSDDAITPNAGRLGGHGRIVGDESYMTREGQAGESSRALEFPSDPLDSQNISYVETDYTLEALGLATEDREFTFALWLRSEEAHAGTYLSAARTGGLEQAISLGVNRTNSNGLSPLELSLRGESWRKSSIKIITMPERLWIHLAWVFGRDGRILYVNGEQRSSEGVVRLGLLEKRPKLWLGAQQGELTPTLPFRGAMDDVRIYRRALTADAVKLLAR